MKLFNQLLLVSISLKFQEYPSIRYSVMLLCRPGDFNVHLFFHNIINNHKCYWLFLISCQRFVEIFMKIRFLVIFPARLLTDMDSPKNVHKVAPFKGLNGTSRKCSRLFLVPSLIFGTIHTSDNSIYMFNRHHRVKYANYINCIIWLNSIE